MAFSVVMPALEIAQETGKLIAWRKKEGESVAKGELLLEVETDKAVLEVEAPADGILAGIKVEEGAVVPVGQTIAWIVRPGEAIPAETAPPDSDRATAPQPARPSAVAPSAGAEPSSTPTAKMSPKARRLAKEHAVDLRDLRGSGPGGEILASDILAASEGKPARPAAPAGVETLSSVARLMAERTTQSWTTVPHFFVVREIEAQELIATLKKLKPTVEQASGERLTHTDLLVGLVARVLKKHPRLHASWNGGAIRLNSEVNIAVAMAVEDGVVAAVIPNADRAGLAAIAAQRRALTERARAGHLRPIDVAHATFTISNLGMYQVDAFSAIITPPQAAILAVARIADRVVAIDGQPAVRPMLTLTLSSDHRVVDGARAAEFLRDLAEACRRPEPCLGLVQK
jgi:pyruvate dehydrogenase E2 component (dihydrolipoamide acetyltransferase)